MQEVTNINATICLDGQGNIGVKIGLAIQLSHLTDLYIVHVIELHTFHFSCFIICPELLYLLSQIVKDSAGTMQTSCFIWNQWTSFLRGPFPQLWNDLLTFPMMYFPPVIFVW